MPSYCCATLLLLSNTCKTSSMSTVVQMIRGGDAFCPSAASRFRSRHRVSPHRERVLGPTENRAFQISSISSRLTVITSPSTSTRKRSLATSGLGASIDSLSVAMFFVLTFRTSFTNRTSVPGGGSFLSIISPFAENLVEIVNEVSPLHK